MKINKLFSCIMLLVAALVMSACKETIPDIGEPFSKVAGLTANDWVIAEVFLIDEGNPARPERNITKFFNQGGNLLSISFHADGSFEVAPGEGLNFFPDSGTWSFDDNEAPTKIILVSEEGQITEAPLGGPTRISDAQLKLNFVRNYCYKDGKDEPVLGYRLVFNRK